MTMETAYDVIARLDEVLEEERQALLNGSLDEIAEILKKKEDLIDAFSVLELEDSAEITVLTNKLHRNQDLLDHAMQGIRTYMMVSLGSAIFTIVAVEMSRDLQAAGLSADPTRVIQGLIGGLGFLGAGAIIQGDERVGGMVTAASLWLAGGLGLAAGMGYGVFSIVCAILAASLLAVSRIMENRGSVDRPDLKD